MPILNNPAGYLLTGVGTGVSAIGAAMDTRNAMNYGFLQYATYSPSAILLLQGSPTPTGGWMTILTITGTPTTGSAQVAGYFPYIRGAVSTGYSTTGSAVMYYAPGLVG
jgi:hypothetical protein